MPRSESFSSWRCSARTKESLIKTTQPSRATTWSRKTNFRSEKKFDCANLLKIYWQKFLKIITFIVLGRMRERWNLPVNGNLAILRLWQMPTQLLRNTKWVEVGQRVEWDVHQSRWQEPPAMCHWWTSDGRRCCDRSGLQQDRRQILCWAKPSIEGSQSLQGRRPGLTEHWRFISWEFNLGSTRSAYKNRYRISVYLFWVAGC